MAKPTARSRMDRRSTRKPSETNDRLSTKRRAIQVARKIAPREGMRARSSTSPPGRVTERLGQQEECHHDERDAHEAEEDQVQQAVQSELPAGPQATLIARNEQARQPR